MVEVTEARENFSFEGDHLDAYDIVRQIRNELRAHTWIQRAGFRPFSEPTVGDVREAESKRIAAVVSLGIHGEQADALLRAIHMAADEAAFMTSPKEQSS